MSLRISHVISRKILKWYIKPTCTCKEVHVIMSGEISANVCLV